MTNFPLHGVIPALVTPRDDAKDDVDTARLAALTQFLLGAGVHGIFPTSSTGEAPLLTRDQRRRTIETVAHEVSGAVPVLGGAGAASTPESIRLARDAEAAGATHIALLPLHFVMLSPDELFGYFAAVADSVAVPILLYNFPARTGGQNIPAHVAARLAQSHNVVGLKDSSGDLDNTIRYMGACPPDFAVFVGHESLILSALTMGGAGTICAVANFAPALTVALFEAFRAGALAEARQCQDALLPFKRLLAPGTFPASIKAALALLGLPVGAPFPPVRPLSAAQIETLGEGLAQMGTVG